MIHGVKFLFLKKEVKEVDIWNVENFASKSARAR